MIAQPIRGRTSALALALAALCLGGLAAHARAQAGADHCVDAPLIVANHRYFGNNNSATSDIGQTPCSDSDSYDVWYKFTAGSEGEYIVDTMLSLLDTTLSAFDACGGNILDCNDDADPNNFDYTSILFLQLTPGQTVLIRVAGYGFDQNTFELFITPPPSTATMGACCRGSSCIVESSDTCTGTGVRYVGADAACNALTNFATPCCKADFNQSGGVEIQDIFDFLNAWFANDPRCDINASGGVEVQDIFDFLNAWFAGC